MSIAQTCGSGTADIGVGSGAGTVGPVDDEPIVPPGARGRKEAISGNNSLAPILAGLPDRPVNAAGRPEVVEACPVNWAGFGMAAGSIDEPFMAFMPCCLSSILPSSVPARGSRLAPASKPVGLANTN